MTRLREVVVRGDFFGVSSGKGCEGKEVLGVGIIGLTMIFES